MNHLTQHWGALTKQAEPDFDKYPQIARGLLIFDTPEWICRKIMAGTVTAQDFLKPDVIKPDVGIWWGVLGRDFDLPDIEDFAMGGHASEELVKEVYDRGWSEEDDIWGEIEVVLVAERGNFEPEDNDGDGMVMPGMGMSYIKEGAQIKLVELRYNAGWGWKTLPCSMSVKATKAVELG